MLSNCAIFPKKTAGNFRHGYRCIEPLAKWFEFMELLLGKICPTRAVPR